MTATLTMRDLLDIKDWNVMRDRLHSLAQSDNERDKTMLRYIRTLANEGKGLFITFGSQSGYITDVYCSKIQKRNVIEYRDAEGIIGNVPDKANVMVEFHP